MNKAMIKFYKRMLIDRSEVLCVRYDGDRVLVGIRGYFANVCIKFFITPISFTSTTIIEGVESKCDDCNKNGYKLKDG